VKVRAVALAYLLGLTLVPLAAAAPHLQKVDASSFPELRVSLLAPLGSPAPTLTENGRPVAGLRAVNLGGTKSIVLVVDRSQSMSGRPLRNERR